MATQSVFGTALHGIGSLERIKQYAHVMQEHKVNNHVSYAI